MTVMNKGKINQQMKNSDLKISYSIKLFKFSGLQMGC
jgi:hypothetical protein